MSVHPSDIDRVWNKLGFDVAEKTRDIWATLRINGRIVLQTRRSRGAKGTAGKITHWIRQQMKLNEEQFSQAIACPLTRVDYHEILRIKGLVPSEPGH